MAITWILIAHGSAGKILRVEDNGAKVALVKEFAHPETALKDLDIHTDRPGRTFQSAGPMRSAKSPDEEPKDHERRVFAKEIATFLFTGYTSNSFTKLILVASPNLLGALRKAIEEPVKKVVTHALDKDLFSQALTDKDLVEKIRGDLGLAVF